MFYHESIEQEIFVEHKHLVNIFVNAYVINDDWITTNIKLIITDTNAFCKLNCEHLLVKKKKKKKKTQLQQIFFGGLVLI